MYPNATRLTGGFHSIPNTEPGNYPEKLQRLTSTLYQSLEAIDKDDEIFKEFIGEKLLTAIKAVRKALSVLEPLYQNIEPIDETTTLHICLLLLDASLACHDASK
ncbi:hypothetical protein K1719_000857 [Acacia pycnantha]|nr:hypothetical protein K1719_000857 [Acacia pycnantha]